MNKSSLLKLKIYAMMMRLAEIEKEIIFNRLSKIKKKRIVLVNEEPKVLEFKIVPRHLDSEYFVEKKIHPKHQKNNKYRFKKQKL